MQKLKVKGQCTTIYFTNEINTESVLELNQQIDLAIDYYHSKVIQLFINSPGGEISSLQLFLQKREVLKQRGIVLKTHAISEVASAAAMILSCGDIGHRTASAHAKILYHTSRAMGNFALTSALSKKYLEELSETDQQLLKMLMAHQWQLFSQWSDESSFPKSPVKFSSKTLDTLSFKELDEESRFQNIQSMYQELFELDEFISAQQAMELYLIDQIVEGGE